MTDAISRSAAYIGLSDALDTIYNIDISDCTDVDDIVGRIYEAVGAIPDADVVPVVRCKDCWKQGGYQCPMFDDETYRDGSKEDGFCHDGERMESVLYD